MDKILTLNRSLRDELNEISQQAINLCVVENATKEFYIKQWHKLNEIAQRYNEFCDRTNGLNAVENTRWQRVALAAHHEYCVNRIKGKRKVIRKMLTMFHNLGIV